MRAVVASVFILSLCVAACDRGVADSAVAPRHGPTPVGTARSVPFDAHILVDQFGYRPEDPKVAVIRNPQVGYDQAQHFVPGPDYQVRRVEDGGVVFSGRAQPWEAGQLERSSGDVGWWFDFGSLSTPGSYYVVDVARQARSATFRVQENVYAPLLKAAVRMYYYQRSGFAKQSPYAAPCWCDEPAYLGPQQDLQARDITDRDNPAKVRSLPGGWFDAGDTNKYVTFAAPVVHQLLNAYERNPAAFTDDFGIPESGNGIPDLLDEVKWETDWLERMQYPDGSAALKVGEIVDATGVKPSLDRNARYYIPSCTSATIGVAGAFAHAALAYDRFPAWAADVRELRVRARRAWENYQHTPQQTHCDTGLVRAGNADWTAVEQSSAAVVAAVYLFALTDDAAYGDYVKAHYKETRPYRDIGWSRYNPEQGQALLYYAHLPGADAGTAAAILADEKRDTAAQAQVYGFRPSDDLYRAYLPDEQYHWGSNAPRANYGNTNLDAVAGADPEAARTYRARALEILHYFHGVNPLGMVYLSNMYEYGATRSVNEIYHTWFWHGSRWSDALQSECGPAPGFVPGGPNVSAQKNGVPASLSPPTGQPPQKSYRDWNTGWPESSWTVSEPGIYYQSAYIELLSAFVH